MARDTDDGGFETPDLFPTPPGFKTRPLGPLGVPVPVPDADDAGPEPTDQGTDRPLGPEPEDESPIGTDGTGSLRETAEMGENYLDRVEKAIDKETCGYCVSVLRKLRGRSTEEQVQGVRELAQLKDEMAAGAEKEDIDALIEDFDVLDDPSEFL